LASADFTPTGLRIEGAFENDRNLASSPCFKAVIREAFGVNDVIIGHHLIYESRDQRPDGFTYEIVEEIPSADALIFDHDIAHKIWGEDYLDKLRTLACEPVATRDKLFAQMFYARGK
jgi:hypothetical protein